MIRNLFLIYYRSHTLLRCNIAPIFLFPHFLSFLILRKGRPQDMIPPPPHFHCPLGGENAILRLTFTPFVKHPCFIRCFKDLHFQPGNIRTAEKDHDGQVGQLEVTIFNGAPKENRITNHWVVADC